MLFRPAADFKNDMDKWILAFKNATPISSSQKVIIPGEPEVAFEKDRRANGIPKGQPKFANVWAIAKSPEIIACVFFASLSLLKA